MCVHFFDVVTCVALDTFAQDMICCCTAPGCCWTRLSADKYYLQVSVVSISSTAGWCSPCATPWVCIEQRRIFTHLQCELSHRALSLRLVTLFLKDVWIGSF